MLTIAFLVGTLLAVNRAKKYRIPHYEVVSSATIIIIASIVGSRILYILEHIEIFSDKPISSLLMWKGGLSYHGGLILAIIALFLWLKKKKIAFGTMLDIFTPSLAFGFFLVRIGCFLNGCCFGKPTDIPLGVIFPSDSHAGLIYENTKIHPTQLYSLLAGLLGFFILLWLEKRLQFARGTGILFLFFLIFSALWRFSIEFFRYQETDSLLLGQFSEAQIFCLGIVVFTLIMIPRTYKKAIQL
jgi:phosphatidylglycerol:prolipoprotein diacylglycerol transferase